MNQSEKVGRTVRLESHLNERLLALCHHLGVNPNAYLLNKIGDAISRDEVSFLLAKNASSQQSELSEFIKLASGIVASPED